MITIDSEARQRRILPQDLDNMAERYRTESGLFTFTSPSLWTYEKHFFFLLRNSIEVDMDPKYIQRPWLLSYDQYGTVIYEHLLMYLNGIFSAEDFNLATVVLPTKRAIREMVTDRFPKRKDVNLLEIIEW